LLVYELDHPRPGGRTTLTRLTDVLFIYALRAWSASNEPARPGRLYGLRDPDIAAALAGMHGHPERPWSVEDLAELAKMSRAAFARRFTALVGEPPLAYLTRWRMELAARHLRESNDLVAHIAERVGYRSEYAFSRAFSRAFDEPPGRYRRAHRASAELHRQIEANEAS
jgi:transcriptional regulator GlxA family with amidase domain